MTELTTLPPATEVPGPGIHPLTDEEYFGPALASTTLSSTGARELLKPGGPARFRHKADTGTVETKREFDVGHAVHTIVLGSGPDVVLFPGTGANPEAWQKADDKAAVAALRAEGKVPLRPADYRIAHAMASAVYVHPLASALLRQGRAEQTLIWDDEATGVRCRAKADWLRPDGIVDVKTAADASEDALVKASYNHGYAVQASFYLRGFRARSLPGVVPFFSFIAVEKEPPYLVHVTQLTERALTWGDRQVSEALAIYRDCTAAGVWPGYPLDEITDIDLPSWVRTEEW
jgi:hypothetical protein